MDDFGEALRRIKKALKRFRSLFGMRHLNVAVALNDLAAMYLRQFDENLEKF